MNKKEFLKSLTEEQLNLIGAITGQDVIKELARRSPKTTPEVKIGDCFVYINDYSDIYLVKVISGNPEHSYMDGQYFDCEEISIDSVDIDMYDINYHLDDFNEHDRIDSEIFNKVVTLVNNRDNAVEEICKKFDKQIREVCLTSLNIPNKNLKL